MTIFWAAMALPLPAQGSQKPVLLLESNTGQYAPQPPAASPDRAPAGVPAPNTPPPPPAGLPAPPGPPPAPVGVPVVQTIPAGTLLTNLPAAVKTATTLLGSLTPGKVWIMQAPNGEKEVKGALLYEGVVVAALRFDPSDGKLLPLGLNTHSYRVGTDIRTVRQNLAEIMKELKVLPAEAFREPEACWSFPLAYHEQIVGEIRIYYDGIHVLPDYPANQEMTFYSQ